MYADVNSRAGVLEPEGMVGIKYRREKLLVLCQIRSKFKELKEN